MLQTSKLFKIQQHFGILGGLAISHYVSVLYKNYNVFFGNDHEKYFPGLVLRNAEILGFM